MSQTQKVHATPCMDFYSLYTHNVICIALCGFTSSLKREVGQSYDSGDRKIFSIAHLWYKWVNWEGECDYSPLSYKIG